MREKSFRFLSLYEHCTAVRCCFTRKCFTDCTGFSSARLASELAKSNFIGGVAIEFLQRETLKSFHVAY